VLLNKFILHNQNNTRNLSEAFIRRSWYSILPSLATMTRPCVKKEVIVSRLGRIEYQLLLMKASERG